LADRFTRRAFLAGLSSTGLVCGQRTKKPREIPRVGEFVRYVDPVTENALVRLTSLSSANRLPAPENAFISARNRFLVFSSDRTGAPAPHLLDLRTGAIRQLAEATALNTESLSLDQAERSLFFLEGSTLRQAQIATRRVTTVAEGVSAFAGRSEAGMLVVRDGRLQRAADGQTMATDVAQGRCLLSPDNAFCLFNRMAGTESELWCLPLRTPGEAKRLTAGPIRFPYWSPDSLSVLFLRDVPGNGVTLSEIHRVSKDGGPEERVAGTSQFGAFAPNSDCSVFVGASRSKAQPTIDLLLEASRRELTLCEHHATNAEMVTPVFAPDSRRVYFQSDREGKPALYSINVELLVEPTIS
jgi:oligogalacturonide lyase